METASPLFSVVIVCYRNGEQWKQAVESVLSQDYPAIELIVSDDGSPDFSCSEAEAFITEKKGANLIRSRVLSSDRNAGTVRNLNRADQLCSGDYLLHFAADDALAQSGVLTAFAAALRQKEPDVLGVYGRSEICDSRLRPVGGCSFDPETAESMNGFPAREQWKQLCRGCCIHLGATAFVRAEFVHAGGFDTEFRIMEDWPFLLKNTREGYRFQFVSFPALYYRQGGVTQQRNPSPGYRYLLTDHLLAFERRILPYGGELNRRNRWRVWMRYLDDRMDGRILFGELSTIPYGKLRQVDSHAALYLAVWWMKRNRRRIAGFLLLLFCLWLAIGFII